MSFRVNGPENNSILSQNTHADHAKSDNELSVKELVEKYEGYIPANVLNEWLLVTGCSLFDVKNAILEYNTENPKKGEDIIKKWLFKRFPFDDKFKDLSLDDKIRSLGLRLSLIEGDEEKEAQVKQIIEDVIRQQTEE